MTLWAFVSFIDNVSTHHKNNNPFYFCFSPCNSQFLLYCSFLLMQTSTVYQTRLFRDTNPSPASHKWTDSFFFFLKWCRARSTAAGDRIKVSAWLTRKESRKKASQTHFILCFYTSHLRVPTEYSEQQSLFEPASTCRAVKPVMRGSKTKNHSSKLSQHSTMLIVGQQTILQRCRSIPLCQGLGLVRVSDKEDSGICFQATSAGDITELLNTYWT